MSTTLYHLTLQSHNAKTGPIPVSTSGAETCPPECPFRGGGCYAKGGPLGIHWATVTAGRRGDEWGTFLRKLAQIPVGSLWRHNQAGDLPGTGSVIDADRLAELVRANQGRRGWTYTHKPVEGDGNVETSNRAAVRYANSRGFAVNLSANSLSHADKLAALGAGPVATVVPPGTTAVFRTPAGRRGVVCPAQRQDGVTCADCGLCAKADRQLLVGFLPHGAGARRVGEIAGQ